MRPLLVIAGLIIAFSGYSQQLYVDPANGLNSNDGTEGQPLKSILEAANRINANHQSKSAGIFLLPGVYTIDQTVLFNIQKFDAKSRLIIRAAVLPDDPKWKPGNMPVIITMVPLTKGFGGPEARGFDIETSHVTIQGIRFTGSHDFTYISPTESRRTYPIWRDGKNLDDLVVTQCLFAGDSEILPLHVGVIANGHGLIIDHCVFYHCRNSVVFWQADGGISRGNAMRYCLVYGSSFSGVWTTQSTVGNEFSFHNNVIANCKAAWIRQAGSSTSYTISDNIFSDNEHMAAFGMGPNSGMTVSDSTFIHQRSMINASGQIEIEFDQNKMNYLQLKAVSNGVQTGAGLFYTKKIKPNTE